MLRLSLGRGRVCEIDLWVFLKGKLLPEGQSSHEVKATSRDCTANIGGGALLLAVPNGTQRIKLTM